MSRLQVPCPIQGEFEAPLQPTNHTYTFSFYEGCDQSLMRTAQLPSHLHGFHPKLLESTIISGVLKPRYFPSRPILPPLPPLPSQIINAHDINPPTVRNGLRKRKRARSPPNPGGQRRWVRLGTAPKDEEIDKEPEAVDLRDLPKFDRKPDQVYDIAVRGKLPETNPAFLLSNAFRIVDPPPADNGPPVSIHYDTFASKVDNMRANGLL